MTLRSNEIRHVTQEHATPTPASVRDGEREHGEKHPTCCRLVWNVFESTARLKLNPWDKKKITRRQGVVHTRRELTIEELQRSAPPHGRNAGSARPGHIRGLRLRMPHC